MATIPLVVEGLTDVAFFTQLVRLISVPTDVLFEPRPADGKDKIPPAVVAQLVAGAQVVIAAEDINHKTPEQIIQSLQDSVSSRLGHRPVDLSPSGDTFRVAGKTVFAIRVGIPEDPDLRNLGITGHAMEDYLMKLLLADHPLVKAVPKFRQLVEELLETIRTYDVPFTSSKDLFQLVKPIIKLGFSDTRIVERLFERADEQVLREVMAPLLQRLEAAAKA